MSESAHGADAMGIQVGYGVGDGARERGTILIRKWDGDATEWASKRLGGDGPGHPATRRSHRLARDSPLGEAEPERRQSRSQAGQPGCRTRPDLCPAQRALPRIGVSAATPEPQREGFWSRASGETPSAFASASMVSKGGVRVPRSSMET